MAAMAASDGRVTLRVVEVPTDDSQLGTAIYPLLRALRPGLTREAFDWLVAEGHRQGLTVLAACDEQNRFLGAALYRVLVTSRGRILFADDLVTAPEIRSTGVGAALIGELERRGRRARCRRMELDSGMSNQAAHRFYYRQRMAAVALHFAKELSTTEQESA
jgi:GNAT superfamily N-acetyltransferase